MGEVNIDHMVKKYSDVVAVDDMSIDIEDGEFIAFVGPSGCGKTTTLECVAGLTDPTEGRIVIGDDDVTDLPPKDRDIAMVFQNIALFPHMDVYDNISFGLRLRNYEDDVIAERVEEAVEILQLDGMLDRMPDELSGGQRQRVAIGRAIVRHPGVFLMDEPLANLDAKLRNHMRTEIQRIQRELDTTAIYVTHDQEEAMTMADRIVIMNDGEVQQFASPLTCYNEPANRFVAGFIGSPSMNFADGVVTVAGVETEDFGVEYDIAADIAPDTEVTIGVRPEDIYLAEDAASAGLPTEPISAVVDVLEPLGDEILTYLRVDSPTNRSGEESQLLVSVEPDSDIEEDDTIEVVLDRTDVHLFDRHTGEALQHGTSTAITDTEQGVGAHD